MANPEHLEILQQGVEQWNNWRHENPDQRPDLSGAYLRATQLPNSNLRGVDLCWANLRWVDLSEADLCEADLANADLFGAGLIQASAQRAKLRAANLGAADFNGANLSEADLSGADLRGAGLIRADLTGARAGHTNFADIDLGAAKGLETIKHEGPSTIGIDTIYNSRGKIPEVFLRGCGVPEEFIDFIRQVGLRPIEFYSCFISYSTKDQEFAKRLHADLQAEGVRCWFAPEEMKAGRKLHEQIDEAIRLHDKLLLILSEHSMSSNWVQTEIANAREREAREKKQMLFPITLVPYEDVKKWKLFDADRGKDSAKEVREYFIPDFSNWKDHDAYQTAFQRLVKDLKSSGQ